MEQKIGNIIDQMQTTMEGMLERLAKLEGALHSLRTSKKPSIYIDERTALLSSEEADIRWINNEMSKVREEDGSSGDKEDAVL